MSFWTALAEHVWAARTPFVVLAYIVTRALVSGAQGTGAIIERYHLRAAATLIVVHVIAMAVGVAQLFYGYSNDIALLTSFAFEALAVVSLGVTAVFRVLLPRVGFALPRIMVDILTGIGVIVVFIIVGKRAGFSVAGLITTSAVLTAVIGFSLQDTLGNVMGGLAVQLDKSITVGDWVNLGDVTGKVVEIRWRYTALETREWTTVIVPNSAIVKSQVTIVGKRTGEPLQTRREVDFYIDYRTPPTKVIAIVESTLRNDQVPNAARTPEPDCLFMGIKDSVVHYRARYWLTDIALDDPTDSAVRTRIWFALQRAGITMAIPASTVFLTQETAERTQRKAERDIQQRMRALAKVDLFSGLAPELLRALANQLVFTPYALGEAITHEGDNDDGLFMIVEGEAVVRIGQGLHERDVARLGPGQFFGEMSLMTGEARTATVIAATDLVCYRIDKSAFEEILRETPEVADQIAEVLANRRTALSAARSGRKSGSDKDRVETAKQDLLGRIRGFFKLDASR